MCDLNLIQWNWEYPFEHNTKEKKCIFKIVIKGKISWRSPSTLKNKQNN